MENLKVKRGHIKGKLTRFKQFLSKIDRNNLNEKVFEELRLRVERYEPLLDEFDSVQSELEALQLSDIDESDRDEFETLYYEVLGEANALMHQFRESVGSRSHSVLIGEHSLRNLNASNASVHSREGDFPNYESDVAGAVCDLNINVDNKNAPVLNNSTSFCGVKLPPINLPKFDGGYNNWLEFKDAFKDLVDGNPSLTDYQRFYYLRCSVVGEAENALKQLDKHSKNYKKAWEILCDRFENISLMIHNHIKAIHDFPTLKFESRIELRNLFDSTMEHIHSLNSLGEKTEHWDRIIIFIMASKFDKITQRDWESFDYAGKVPTLLDMSKFIKQKCQVLEKCESNLECHSNKVSKKRVNTGSFISSDIHCIFCKEFHHINNCSSFINLPVQKRIDEIKKRKLCLNCLKPSHFYWKCNAKKCIKCKKPHNSLLHLSNKISRNTPVSTTDDTRQKEVVCENDSLIKKSASSFSAFNSNHTNMNPQVLLSTAIVKVICGERLINCRALLDNGSQSHFITDHFCNKYNIQQKNINFAVQGVGQMITDIERMVGITILSCYNDFSIDVNCLVLPRITNKLPNLTFNKNILNIPNSIHLADPTFHVSNDIDLLLGSSIFWLILCEGQIKLGNNLPVLQNTSLGWIISGSLFTNKFNSISLVTCTSTNDSSLDELIAKFWNLEEINVMETKKSKVESYCEKYFEESVKRNHEGRFIVRIPFNNLLTKLGNSKDIAMKRFFHLEKRLMKNPDLQLEYVKFMKEYENLGHMTEISRDHEEGYYIPHHAVIKTSSLTTKCRVVFDASAVTDTGISLNHTQFVGPTLQNDLFSILCRFRKYRYVMVADISKMYRQILIADDQRKYQKIFWRADSKQELKCFQLNTVTYGTASAPFLAVKCLIQIADDNFVNYSVASEKIKNDFYMDDFLSGADTLEELVQLQRDISKILYQYGFELRKWLTNETNVLNHFHVNSQLDLNILQIGGNENNKTLGIFWCANKDFIKYSIKNFEEIKVSKRNVLSVVCQIFDPLGLLNPVVVTAKLLIQELWKRKIPWDTELPIDLKNQWLSFLKDLKEINNLEISRQALISHYITIEIHGFSDASCKAYGACVYIRCCISNNNFYAKLMCAKSRVAPLKQISLPRLELCGAVLLANLLKKCEIALKVSFNQKYFWSDSMITLAWIKADSSRWKTFVANRVGEIQTLCDPNDWNFVKSSENPADLLSRGVSPSFLCSSELWWKGPSWFYSDNNEWDLQDVNYDLNIPEQKIVSHMATDSDKDSLLMDQINKHSSFKRLQRVVAYIYRFINNLKGGHTARLLNFLTVSELQFSTLSLIKAVQRKVYPKEYYALLKNQPIHKKSSLLSLSPFQRDGVIRVGGRIQNSNLDFDSKHPIILPKHRLTDLILKNEHEQLLHCGAQLLLCSIREKYWPITGRNLCKKIVRKCITCFKAKPQETKYVMGNLPEHRVNKYLPFVNVGVDYGGPFLMKDRKTRGAKIVKVYICLFICMSTKAVHIELVSELTANAFMLTLKRFIARRGKPSKIISDNGSNFVGSNNEITKIYDFLKGKSDIYSEYLSHQGISWEFIPSNSPNFGGIWEAGIKSCKFHLKRVLNQKSLTFEEFSTLLAQVESILNSRPLCPLSEDPNDFSALTPGHFLIGRSLNSLPEYDFTESLENRLNRFEELQAIFQHYWKRWQKEYVTELQHRVKWKQLYPELIKIGTLVLVKDDKIPPMNWQLGRVEATYPGVDGTTRVVDVRVHNGIIRRAVSRLCSLPID